MPKVSTGKSGARGGKPTGGKPTGGKGRGKTQAPPPPVRYGEQVRASSVLFGLVIITALIVATAAWMGGSMGQIGTRMANTADGAARALGLSVKSVQVTGLSQSPELEAEVRAAVMIEPGENMFRADPAAIRKRVEATGKVANVRVNRLWPDMIVVLADPAVPVALYRDEAGWVAVDTLGRTRPEEDPGQLAALPRLAGEGAAEASPVLFEALAAHPDIAARLEGAVRRSQARWSLALSGDVVVHLPEDAKLGAALEALSGLQAKTDVLNGAFRVVDARASALPEGQRGGPQIFLTPREVRTALQGGVDAG